MIRLCLFLTLEPEGFSEQGARVETGASQVLLGISCRKLLVALPPGVQGLIIYVFSLDRRAPQRAAIPLQKMKTLKVGAVPWRGRAPNCDPGTSTLMGPPSFLSLELGVVPPYTIGGLT